jgi:hypothetical protein
MDLSASINTIPERRGKPRMQCAYRALVNGYSHNGTKFEENGTVLNLSASGAYLLLNRFVQNGQALAIKIAFPTGSLEWGSSKLTSNGVVVRTEPVSDGVLGAAIFFQHYRFG